MRRRWRWRRACGSPPATSCWGLLDALDDDPATAGRELAARVAATPGQGAAVLRALATWERTGDVASALADETRLRAVVDLHD